MPSIYIVEDDTDILAIESYALDLAKTASAKRALDDSIPCVYETSLVRKLSVLTDLIYTKIGELEDCIVRVKGTETIGEEADMIRDELLMKMSELRIPCDEGEMLTAKKYWPYPTYSDLLFGVR